MREEWEAEREQGEHQADTTSDEDELDADPDNLEAAQAVNNKWRWLPGYNKLPDVPRYLYRGWWCAKPYQIPFPKAPEELSEVQSERGRQASWEYALYLAVDAAYRFHRPSAYTCLPTDIDTLGAWLTSIRNGEDRHIPSAQVYLSQLGQPSGDGVTRAGFRDTVQSMDDILVPTTFLCGASGVMRFAHNNDGKSPIPQLKASFGWKNLIGEIRGGTCIYARIQR